LDKNAAHLHTLFALADLVIAKGGLLALDSQPTSWRGRKVRKSAQKGRKPGVFVVVFQKNRRHAV